jgi:hypothetical protein
MTNNTTTNNNNKQERENMHTDRCGHTSGQKCHTKGSRKETKYNSLCIEIQRMWDMKCMIIPVVTGATWIVIRGLRKNLETIPGKHWIDSLEKTAVLGTSHNTESTAVWNLIPKRWGSPLVQEEYQGEMTCDKRWHNNNNNNHNHNHNHNNNKLEPRQQST